MSQIHRQRTPCTRNRDLKTHQKPLLAHLRKMSFSRFISEKTPKHPSTKKDQCKTPEQHRKNNASKNEPVESGKRSLSVTIDVDEPSLKLKSEYRFFIGY